MSRFFVAILLWAAGFAHAQAQQNLFNIPSGAITPRGEVFYQHQVNVYGLGYVASKQHVVLGLGRGWDVGANLLGLSFRDQGRGFILQENATPQGSQLKPALVATWQKQWQLADHWRLNLGGQFGGNLSQSLSNKQLLAFNYLLAVWQRGHTRLVAGPYWGTPTYLGPGNQAGMLVGAEYGLTDRLLLMGDWIVGTNDESVMVAGLAWLATPHIQLCLGGQLPSFDSDNKPAIVFELNLLSWREWPADNNSGHH